MDFRPADLRLAGLEPQLLQILLHEHQHRTLPRLDRLWEYYRNQMVDGPAVADARMGQRRYRLAQEQGLPVRLSRSTDSILEEAQLHREMRRLETLGVLERIYSAAAQCVGEDQALWKKACYYRERFGNACDRAMVLLDANGDGIADLRRSPSLIQLHRT